MRSLLSVLMLTLLLAAVVATDSAEVKDGEDVGDGETLGGGEAMAEVDDGEVGSSQGDGDEKKEKRKSRTQHLSKEVKELRKQVEDMLREIQNQNHAIFKHADHNRILSGKVSAMSKELAAMKRDRSLLEEKVQLNEFKAAKRNKKNKAKIAEAVARIDLCKCPAASAASSANNISPYSPVAGGGAAPHGIQPNYGSGSTGYNYGSVGSGIAAGAGFPDEAEREEEEELAELEAEIEKERREKKRRKKERKRKKKQERRRKSKKKSVTNATGKTTAGDKSGNSNPWRLRGSNHILLTGGSTNATEVLDPSSSSSARQCPRFAPYPLGPVKGAVGAFVSGRPLICGGRSSVEDYYDRCFAYQVGNDSWVEEEHMMERRFQATALMIDSKRWWITGGFSGVRVYNTTEIYHPGKGFTQGPSLPEVTFQHCLVKINATHVFNVGGFPYSNNVWLMDFEKETWTKMKPIAHSRDAPHCAMVERRNGKVEVIVAGGSLPGSELSTEIFSVTDNRWRNGPNLPQAVIYGVSVSYRNSLLILGGREMGGDLEELDLVFQYDPLEETWSQLPSRLDVPRTSFVAVSLPDYLNCANNFRPGKDGRVRHDRYGHGYRYDKDDMYESRRGDVPRYAGNDRGPSSAGGNVYRVGGGTYGGGNPYGYYN